MQNLSNLALVADPATDAPEQALRVKLLLALQTTLALDRLLALFSQEIAPWIPHDGLCYCHQERELALCLGKRAPHRCHYRLSLEGQDLGEISLLRRKRFSEQELSAFESLLCCLVYPLRNALLYQQALKSSYTDPLTGVLNRSALHSAFEREWKLAKRQGTPLSVLVLDIDHFKAINDTYGHAAGDRVLVKVAACLQRTVRSSDMIFRYGGEEFVILLSNTHLEGAKLLAQRVLLALRNLDCTEIAPKLRLTASIGVAVLEDPEESCEKLLKRADEALYEAKRQGRDRIAVARWRPGHDLNV